MFTEPYMATIAMFTGSGFVPQNWAICDGTLLSVADNSALFSLISNKFGGDGVSTFALPNLQSRVAIHPGQGPGLANYVLGQTGGQENVTMSAAQVPGHTHDFVSLTGAPGASTEAGGPGDPTNNVAAVITNINSYNISGSAKLAPTVNTPSTVISGNSQAFSNLPPYQVLTYIICTEGIFPPRG